MRSKILILVALFFAIGVQAARSQRPCSGVVGQQRTRCLQVEVARATAIANQANANLQQLNARMNSACAAASMMDRTASVAQTVGEISSYKPFQFGGMTWTSVRQIMSRLTSERANCANAQRAVANARRSP